MSLWRGESGRQAKECARAALGPQGGLRLCRITASDRSGPRNYGDRDKGLAPLSLCESR
jgi:hypothetical protein